MKKKILFINGHLNAGGVEKSLADILRHFDYTKYDVELLLLEGVGDYISDLPEELKIRLVDLHNTYGSISAALIRCIKQRDWLCFKMRLLLFMQKFWNASNLRYIRSVMFGKRKYDVAVGFRPGICTNLAAFAVDADKRITWWHHGEYNLDSKAEIDYCLACKKMDAVVSVSESCAAFLREKLPEISDKLTVIPNLLDCDAICQKAGLFNPYAGDGARRHLVSVGRLSPEKHVENAVMAAYALVEKGMTDFKWYVVGDGSERETLEQFAADKGVSGYIVFVGSQPNPYPYMKYADLFVHPSYVESQGLVVLEAMTLGVPCVVTKSLGPCEFIEDGVNGILAEQSPESLAEKALSMIQDRNLYERIKANTCCPGQFLPENIMLKIDKLLEAE